MDRFSKNLKRYLLSNELNQSDLSRELKVSRALISKWCNGKSVPNMDMTYRIANYLHCSVDDLTRSEMDNTFHYNFARRLRELMDSQDVPIERIASFCNVQVSTVEDWMWSRLHPTREQLKPLTDVLHCSVDDLLNINVVSIKDVAIVCNDYDKLMNIKGIMENVEKAEMTSDDYNMLNDYIKYLAYKKGINL